MGVREGEAKLARGLRQVPDTRVKQYQRKLLIKTLDEPVSCSVFLSKCSVSLQMYLKFVKAQEPGFLSDVFGNWWDRIQRLGVPNVDLLWVSFLERMDSCKMCVYVKTTRFTSML